jgi:subtilisin-like proprotein convertase family protein
MISGVSIEDDRIQNIARVLQTADKDNNLSNGIQLVSFSSNLKNIDFTNENNITTLLQDINSSHKNIANITKEAAKAHLEKTLNINIEGTDTNFTNQWHLDATHLNTTTLHTQYNGSQRTTIIQIVDDGIQTDHPDLIGNIDFGNSYNAQKEVYGNADPSSSAYSHGTKVAGIAAARGFNGIGVRGVAPFTKIAGFKAKTYNGYLYFIDEDLQKAWLTSGDANNITVSSNSWGRCTSTDTTYENILELGTKILRDGKGRVYVKSAGNDRDDGDSSCQSNSANLNYVNNNPYIITVAALNKNNKFSSYSNPGSNILISAYGGEDDDKITTTTTNSEYTNKMDGTSASTPMVSAGIALIIEECGNLTYRDVAYILASTATKIDANNPNWEPNSAGLHHNIDYGFGKLNISKAIDMCKGQNEYSAYKSLGGQENITDANGTKDNINSDINSYNIATSHNITISNNVSIEWVGLYTNLNVADFGKFEFKLTSPSGTTTKLLHFNNPYNNIAINGEIRLSSVAFMKENSQGNWTVTITDKRQTTYKESPRQINSLKLHIIGKNNE